MDVKVTQGTSTTTAVPANGEVGLITCFTSGAWGTNGIPVVDVNNCVAGTSFDIKEANAGTAALAGVLTIAFALL